MRQVFDRLLAAAGFVLCSPVLVLVAAAIILDSPGSPLYFAPRIGRGGRLFKMWKFRTMTVDAAVTGGPITGRNDRRITRAGRFLRKTKLDELPQLINVLLGDMTLVGPRPEAPEIVALYSEPQRAVLRVRPGMTGTNQIRVQEESEVMPIDADAREYYVRHLMERKLHSDLAYLERRTVVSDLGILLSTANLILRSLTRTY